jgi:mutator protein MutT
MTDRFYPDRPYVGVGAVIVDRGRVVLIKRKHEPLAGHWSLPGGAVELGESLEDCVRREILEETGLEVEVGPVIEVFERITRDAQDAVSYHFVLVDYLCWRLGGELRAATDVADAALVPAEHLEDYGLTAKATEVIRRGLTLAAERSGTR